MQSDQLTPDILKTRSGGCTVFVGVVRKIGDGKIVWRSEQWHNRQVSAWRDAERGFVMMNVVEARGGK